MRKTGHSPGPWKWRPVYDEKGKALALLLDCADELRGPVTAIREDRAFWAGYPDRHFGKSEDGRLIAAAPAMLKALQTIEARVEAMLDGSHHGPWSADYLREIAREILGVAQEAVEDARGEEPTP